MSFVSVDFAIFFAATLVGLALMPTRHSRHAFLLVANLVFYAAGTPRFVVVLLVPSIVDYACAIRMEDSDDPAARRQWLVLSLIVNLGVLCYFKYSNFLVDDVARVLGANPGLIVVLLPVGIS